MCILDQTVPFIGLVGDFGLTLEKALSIYGEPDQLVYSWQAVGDPVALRVVLFYLEKGLVISFKQSDLDTITLEPENKIDYILFYDLALYPEIVTRLVVEKEDLQEHQMDGGRVMLRFRSEIKQEKPSYDRNGSEYFIRVRSCGRSDADNLYLS